MIARNYKINGKKMPQSPKDSKDHKVFLVSSL